ncbi:MAG: acylase [Symploca sp. SIO3E6]|nr:acylase [Caldora sp. SIO3E6]
MSQMRRLATITLLLLSLALVVFLGIYKPFTEVKRTEILWDNWGVPHVYGKDAKGLFQAFGWAQMQSHGNLILRLYGQARGRAAEYLGEEYLESDQYVRTMGIPTRAKKWYEAQSPNMREYLDAFAAGINAYAQDHPEQIDEQVKLVLPVDGIDILGHVQRVIHFHFVVSPRKLASLVQEGRRQNPPLTPPWRGIGGRREESLYSKRSNLLSLVSYFRSAALVGSNGWAIAPDHSASGHAMLLANPHLPWSDLYLLYEAQLTAPEIAAYGAAFVGMPLLAIAFNEHLGWTTTVNTFDGADLYELTLADGGYRWDGATRPFETQTQTLKVKQKDGTLREEQLVVRRSIHGPIIAEKEGKATALRVVGLEEPQLMKQLWEMALSTNLQEFEAALQPLQLPMFNFLYADQQGQILYLFNAQIPVRSQGDWDYWQGVIPGEQSDTLWTQYHSYQDLPHLLNPSSGWLQNTNDPPWTSTFPPVLNPQDYPPYFAPSSLGKGGRIFRTQCSIEMLLEKEQISWETMIADKFSSRMKLADRILDDLIPAARQLGNELGRQAADILEVWDRQANADSRGAVLFSLWAQQMLASQLFAIPWSKDSPLSTPDGLANPTRAVEVLEEVALQLKSIVGALDIPWGEVVRLRYGEVDLPASGAPGTLGSFQVIDIAPVEAIGVSDKFQAFFGDTYIAAIEFSQPVRAKVLMTYGNATQPGSSHIGDQLSLYSQGELRPVWRSRKAIKAHLESHQVF